MRATELLHTLSCWCYRMCTTTRLCSTVETSHCGSREGTSALRLLTWHDVMAQAAEHGHSSGCSGLHLSLQVRGCFCDCTDRGLLSLGLQ